MITDSTLWIHTRVPTPRPLKECGEAQNGEIKSTEELRAIIWRATSPNSCGER